MILVVSYDDIEEVHNFPVPAPNINSAMRQIRKATAAVPDDDKKHLHFFFCGEWSPEKGTMYFVPRKDWKEFDPWRNAYLDDIPKDKDDKDDDDTNPF